MLRRYFYNNGDNFIKSLCSKLSALEPFSKLSGLSSLPDIYFKVHSPFKTCRYHIEETEKGLEVVTWEGYNVFTDQNEKITLGISDFNDMIADRLISHYKEKWTSEVSALLLDYDLLENGKTTTNYNPNLKTTTDNSNSSTDSTHSVQGFNSSDYVPSDKTETTYKGSGFVSQTGKSVTETAMTGGNVDERILKRLELRKNVIYDRMMDDIDVDLTTFYYQF